MYMLQLDVGVRPSYQSLKPSHLHASFHLSGHQNLVIDFLIGLPRRMQMYLSIFSPVSLARSLGRMTKLM